MPIKEEILAAVAQALEGMGITSQGGDEYGEQVEENNVPIWSKIDASVPDAGRGPIHDRGALFNSGKMSKPPEVGNYMTDQYGMPMPGDEEAGMLAMGML